MSDDDLHRILAEAAYLLEAAGEELNHRTKHMLKSHPMAAHVANAREQLALARGQQPPMWRTGKLPNEEERIAAARRIEERRIKREERQ